MHFKLLPYKSLETCFAERNFIYNDLIIEIADILLYCTRGAKDFHRNVAYLR